MSDLLLDQARSLLGSCRRTVSMERAYQALKKANGYVLDNKFCEMAVSAAKFDAVRMKALANNAQPTHDVMFIEWNHTLVRQALGQNVKDPVSNVVGYLIFKVADDVYELHDFTLYTEGVALQNPLRMRYSTVGPIKDEHRFDKDFDYMRVTHHNGATSTLVETIALGSWLDTLDVFSRRNLSERACVDYAEPFTREMIANHEKQNALFSRIILEQTGTLWWLWAVLGLMNLYKLKVSEPMKRGEGTYTAKKGTLPFMEYRTVSVLVPGQRKPSTYFADTVVGRGHRRNHRVDSHFRHYAKDVQGQECHPLDHVWEEVPGTVMQRCTTCGLKRTRIPSHRRGDEKLGIVEHGHIIKGANQ